MNAKIAYFDCFAGISGDMTLGALVDAGADFNGLKSELDKLGLHEFHVTAEKVIKRGISATDITVHLDHHHHDHSHHSGHSHGRSFTDIKHIIENSGLSQSVKDKAVAIFRRLGNAEAKVHGKDIEEIHFHEVGAVDAIVDITGACICLEMLGIEKVYASPMPTFTGTIEIAHGTFPLPAPATAEILKGVPWRKLGVEGEIITPTGAAIIAEFAEDFGECPPMTVHSIGYGAGKRDFGMPNVLRVMVGEAAPTASEHATFDHTCGGEHTDVAVLETNIDDLSPQVYEVVMERLFAAGALDVYLTPIQMKKNRPATLVSIICAPCDIDRMSAILFEETSTIGVRIARFSRLCLSREFLTVQTAFGPVKIKVSRRGGEVVNVQPEYEDCKAAASKEKTPFKRVRDAALIAAYKQLGLTGDLDQ